MRADIHFQRYQLMLEYQENNKPWTPSITDLIQVWGVQPTAAHRTLKLLKASGLCITRKRGNIQQYYAVVPK